MKRIEKKGRLTFGLAALAAALVLTGCVTVPPAGIEPSPGAQALSAGLAPDARLTGERMAQHWWTIFGDETLNKVIQDALKKNLDIRTAVARIDEARASLGVVQAERLPSVGMNAGYSRQALSEYDPMALLGAPTEATSAWRLGGAASWELDLWGHVRYRTEAAGERLQSAALQAENVRVSTAAEIARTYLLLRGTEAEIALLEKDLAAQKKLAEIAKARCEAGAAVRTEAAAAQAELLRLSASMKALEKERSARLNALAKLSGEAPHALDARLANAAFPLLPASVPVGLSSELARHRPDILIAEKNLRAALAEIGAAKADFYPRVSLSGSFGLQSLEFSDLGSWDARTFSIGPSFYLPLFEGGRLRQTLELTQARERTAAIQYRKTVLDAWHEVNDALQAYSSESDRLAQLGDAVRKYRVTLAVAQSGLRAGTTEPAEVLRARRTLIASENAETGARTRTALAIVSLCRSLGGGFTLPEAHKAEQ